VGWIPSAFRDGMVPVSVCLKGWSESCVHVFCLIGEIKWDGDE
jgi:hypothetical protein